MQVCIKTLSIFSKTWGGSCDSYLRHQGEVKSKQTDKEHYVEGLKYNNLEFYLGVHIWTISHVVRNHYRKSVSRLNGKFK